MSTFIREKSFVDCGGPGASVPVGKLIPKNLFKLGIRFVRVVTTVEGMRDAQSTEHGLLRKYVDECLQAGLRVIVDNHTDFADPSDVYRLPYQMYQIGKVWQEYKAKDVALQFKNEARFRGGRELPTEQYESFEYSCVSALRASNPIDGVRWVVAGNPGLNGYDWFSLLSKGKYKPMKTDRLIVPAHDYNPFNVTHPYSYQYARTQSVDEEYPPTNLSSFEYKDYLNAELHVKNYDAWCVANNVYPFIGEFGCWDTVKNHIQCKLDKISLYKKYQIPFAIWEFRGKFGLGKYDDTKNSVEHVEVLKAMVS